MKIGIFGGTFDPPHWGHLLLAEFVRDELELDEVFLLPALLPPHKTNRVITDARLRYAMVKVLCGDDKYIRPSDADLTHERKPSFTIDLLDELLQKYPENSFYPIIGGDSVLEFTTWRRWEEILEKYDVIALPRPGQNISAADKRVLEKIRILKSPLVEISSTEIRRRVKSGKSIRFMTTKAVVEFIYKQNLYG